VSATHPLAFPTARLFKIYFYSERYWFVAEVGKEIHGWLAHVGPVAAIIETTTLVYIHTRLRGGVSTTPIVISGTAVWERTYFDDFPAEALPVLGKIPAVHSHVSDAERVSA
jgi:hypothetical protein